MTKLKLIEIPMHLFPEDRPPRMDDGQPVTVYIAPSHLISIVSDQTCIDLNLPDGGGWNLKNCPETTEFLNSFVEFVTIKPSTTKKEASL